MEHKILTELKKNNISIQNQKGWLYSYSYDAALEKSLPVAVVFPETTKDIQNIIKLCNKYNIPYLARGSGTNLSGGSIPLNNSIVVCLSKMNKILNLDLEKKNILVEAGCINQQIQDYLKNYDFFYPPDPASQRVSTIGGNIAENAGGPRCLKFGVTTNNVEMIELITPDAEIYNLSIYDAGFETLGLFVGSEGTLGIVTKAKLKILKLPKKIVTIVVSFPSTESAMKSVGEITSSVIPLTLEALDRTTIDAITGFIDAKFPKTAECVFLIELTDKDIEKLELLEQICKNFDAIDFISTSDQNQREKLWQARKGAYPSMAKIAPNVLVEDGTVPLDKLPQTVSEIKKITQEYNLKLALIFHAGDGNLHPMITFDERNKNQTQIVKDCGLKILKKIVQLGGTISGEHGIGIDKKQAMKLQFDYPTLNIFWKIKKAFDPKNLSNPEKLLPEIKPPTHPQKFSPNITEIIEKIKYANKKILITGTNTILKNNYNGFLNISTKKLNSIVKYNKINSTITVESGLLIKDLLSFLNDKQTTLNIDYNGTVGGLLSVLPSYITRNFVLGLKVILASGEIICIGGEVLKNVAGYDIVKVFLGSMGWLGVITEITLKLNSEIVPSYIFFDKNLINKFKPNEIQKKLKFVFDENNIFFSPFVID